MSTYDIDLMMKSDYCKQLISFMVNRYKYRNLPTELSITVRQKYHENLPSNLKEDGDKVNILSPVHGIIIASGYDRIVIGDYGAFIEIDESHIFKDNLKIAQGQEYRINDEKYVDKIKFIWLSTITEECKIYLQKRTVSYADYIPGKYYISPFEVKLGE